MSGKNKDYQSEYNSWMNYISEKLCQDMIKLYGPDEGMKIYQNFKISLKNGTK